MKKILVIGQGGREHAIAWKLSKSKHVEHTFVVPGNAGMVANNISIKNIDTSNFEELIKFVKKNNIYFTIVGPEVELSLGIVDAFEAANLKIFGPSKYVSQLESSKSFCKEQMINYDIPTAKYKTFNDSNLASEYLKEISYPIVIKADGLAAGKGVVIANCFKDAVATTNKFLNLHKFGDASKQIVIEEFLDGMEFSQLAFVNGDQISYMQIVKDYKRAYDNDEGENTGGMGGITPVDFLTDSQIQEGKDIIKKMVLGMKKSGHPYKGVIYAGLITTKTCVKVIEFNVRFGDPETELILLAMESDLFLVIDSFLKRNPIKIKWSKDKIIGVVLAANGYPDSYKKGLELNIDQKIMSNIFYMGVKKIQNKLVSNGGRVLIVVSKRKKIIEAKNEVYNSIKLLKTKDYFYRKDIWKIEK